MSLSRKRKRELNKLRAQAEAVLEEQREVLGHAGTLAQAAGLQAKHLGDEYVAPRVNEAVATVRPVVDRGVASARKAADRARIVAAPVLAGALASTIRGLERSEQREAAKQLEQFGVQRGLLQPKKKKFGLGRVLAIGAGVAAAGAVGYALWQAFRSDEDLWVSPEG